MVSGTGNFYPNLVKYFYANLVIVPGDNDILTSKVKNTDIILDLEAFRNCLWIPFLGQAFHHGLVPEWEGYIKMDYFFHICRVSHQAGISDEEESGKWWRGENEENVESGEEESGEDEGENEENVEMSESD